MNRGGVGFAWAGGGQGREREGEEADAGKRGLRGKEGGSKRAEQSSRIVREGGRVICLFAFGVVMVSCSCGTSLARSLGREGGRESCSMT